MKLVAGVDIGNATTETAIARIDGKNVTFLSSGITGTTGIKGTKQNIHGVFQSLILMKFVLMKPLPLSVMSLWRLLPKLLSRNLL